MVRKDANSYVQYSKLCTDDTDAFCDAQFAEKSPKIPWKSIGFALVLFGFGAILIIVSLLIMTGHIDKEYSDRIWPLLMLGLLMFIPGSYHTYLAYYAFRGCKGFDFSDIPTYSDD